MDKEQMVVDALVFVQHKETNDPLAFFAFLPFPVVRAIINAGGLDNFHQIPFETNQKPLPSYMETGDYHIDDVFVPMTPMEEYIPN